MLFDPLKHFLGRIKFPSKFYNSIYPESENHKYCRKLIEERRFEDLAWFVNNHSNVRTHSFYNKLSKDYINLEYHEYLNLNCIFINSLINHPNKDKNLYKKLVSLQDIMTDHRRKNLFKVNKNALALLNTYTLMKNIFNIFYFSPIENHYVFSRIDIKYRSFNEINSRMAIFILFYAKNFRDHELLTKLANDVFFHPNYDFSVTIRIDNILDPVFLKTLYYDGFDIHSNIDFIYLYNEYLDYIALSGKTELIQLIFNSISLYLNNMISRGCKTPFTPSKYIKIAYENNHLEAANQLIQETVLLCANNLSRYARQKLFIDLCTLPKTILKESLNSEALRNSISRNISALFINITFGCNEYALEYLFENFSDEINQISDHDLQYLFDNIFNKHKVKALEYLLTSQTEFIVNNREKWLNIALRQYKDIKNNSTIVHNELEDYIKCIEKLTQLLEVAQYLENFIKFNELTNKIEIIKKHPEIESITLLAEAYYRSRKKSAYSSIESHIEPNTQHENSKPTQEIKKKFKL